MLINLLHRSEGKNFFLLSSNSYSDEALAKCTPLYARLFINLGGRPNRSHKIHTHTCLVEGQIVNRIETAIANEVSRHQGSPFLDLENQQEAFFYHHKWRGCAAICLRMNIQACAERCSRNSSQHHHVTAKKDVKRKLLPREARK